MTYIAHMCQEDNQVQTVRAHLLETQALAESFAERMQIRCLAGLAGLLHDVGKYSDDFQRYIQQAVHNPERAPRRGSVDHSTAGGQLLFELFSPPEGKATWEGLVTEIVSNAIFSHHGYLQDFLTPNDFRKWLLCAGCRNHCQISLK